MATTLADIAKDPNYVNANAATKKAIFDKYSATDPNYVNANAATQQAIRVKFGVGASATPAPDEQPAVTPRPAPAPQMEQFGGVGREVGPAMGMLSPEQKREALGLGASFMVGPVLGGAARGAAAIAPRAAPFLRGVVAPVLESGGFQTGLPATASRAAQLTARAVGGATVGGAGAALVAPEDAGYGAAIGGTMSLLAPPLVSRFAGAVGRGLDWLGGSTSDIRAARMLRGVLPDEQLNALRQAVLAAPEGTPPSRVISQLDLPPEQRRPVEVLQALLAKAEAKDPQGVANAFRVAEGEALSNQLAAIAGGETAEAALTTRRGATEALRTGTAPLREEALTKAKETGERFAKLETMQEQYRAQAKAATEFVRRNSDLVNRADDWSRGWLEQRGIGEAGVRLPARAEATTTFPGQLAASGRTTTVGGPFERQVIEEGGAVSRRITQAAEESVRAGAQARTAEATARSMRERGLEPIRTADLVAALQTKLRNPEIALNREANAALTRIIDMMNDWTNERGILDPFAAYAIRKNGVQSVIRELNPGMDAKSVDKFAAQILGEVTPLIDDAIVRSGGTTWPAYMRDYQQGMAQIRAMELADMIRKDYASGTAPAAAKRKIAALIGGESPDVVEELFGSGKYKLSEQMAKDMPVLRQLADTIGFDLKFATQAKAGKEALGELATKQREWRLRFPFFTRASTAVNEIAMALEDKIAAETMEKIIRAAQSGKNFDAALSALSSADRNKVLRVLRTSADWNRFSTGVATAAAGAAAAEPRNALAPENQNALAE